jgi:hypothetical protein
VTSPQEPVEVVYSDGTRIEVDYAGHCAAVEAAWAAFWTPQMAESFRRAVEGL